MSLSRIAVGAAALVVVSLFAITTDDRPGTILRWAGVVGFSPVLLLGTCADPDQRDRWAAWAWRKVCPYAQRVERHSRFEILRGLTNGLVFPIVVLLVNVVCEVASPNAALTDSLSVPHLSGWAKLTIIALLYPMWNAGLICISIVGLASLRTAYKNVSWILFKRTRGLKGVAAFLWNPELPPDMRRNFGQLMIMLIVGVVASRQAPWVGGAWVIAFLLLALFWAIRANIWFFAADATLGPLVFLAIAVGAWMLANFKPGSLSSISAVTWINLGVNTLAALLATAVGVVQIAGRGFGRADEISTRALEESLSSSPVA